MHETTCNTRDPGSIPGSGRSPGGRKWQSTPGLLPRKSQRCLVGYSPWGHKRLGHGLAINFTNNPLSMSEALIHSFIQHIFTNVPVTELCSGDKIVDKETSLYPHPSWVSCSWKGRQIWVWQDFQSHRRHSLQRFLDVQPTLSPNTQPVNGCGYRSCYVFQFGVKIHH